MSDNLAVVKRADSPSQLAFAELQKRVESDADLTADLKAAFLADLQGDTPAALLRLRAALGGEGQDAA